MLQCSRWIVGLITVLLLQSANAVADRPSAPEQIAGTTRLGAEQVVELILHSPNLVIIDARKPEAFKRGHIEGAVNILDTVLDSNILARYASAKDTPLLIYCNGEACLRSTNAATHAVQWGYTQVYWFRGGWQEWTAKELPVSR